jgi:hypothetical protein
MRRALFSTVALIGLAALAGPAGAEPIFLSRQYTRCTTCHYSPTGGGLLTPYGRSLSRQELSTTGWSPHGQAQAAGTEEAFLWGALGNSLGPVSVGIDLRPAHLNLDFGGTSTSRDMFMTADVLAAYRVKGWTLYGELGREPLAQGSKIDSYEYWVSHQSDKAFGIRVGRFLPAYGIRLADHTALTRSELGFDKYDQVYAVEVSHTSQRLLAQLSVGPGPADAVLHDDGRSAFTATGRVQMDIGARSTLVASGLWRDASRLQPHAGAGGLSFGLAPTRHVSVWSEADALIRPGGQGGTAYVLLNETGVEVYRGVWLKFSPQLRTGDDNGRAGVERMAFEANLLPRTHWNVDVSYYRDKNRVSDLVTKTFLAQLHLYL